jgi:Xaa-Pro aminopeptidase
MVAYMAVRSNGYWSEGYVTFSKSESPAKTKAAEALKAMIAAAKPGASAADIARKAPANAHPVIASSAGGGIGLSMDEEPRLTAASGGKLEAGQVLSLRSGVSEGSSHAIVSAMVLITSSGSEVLWS